MATRLRRPIAVFDLRDSEVVSGIQNNLHDQRQLFPSTS